jgi:chromosome segregation ATPase
MAISLLEAIDLSRRGYSLSEITGAIKMQSEFNKLEEDHPEIKDLLGIKQDEDKDTTNYHELYDNEVASRQAMEKELAEVKEQLNLLSIEKENNAKTIEQLQKEITRTNLAGSQTEQRSVYDIFKNR